MADEGETEISFKNQNSNATVNRSKLDNQNRVGEANQLISEETIYKRVVEKCKPYGRNSSSSEEDVDSSSEFVELNQVLNSIAANQTSEKVVATQPQPGTLRGVQNKELDDTDVRAEKAIRQVEIAKGRIFANSGKRYDGDSLFQIDVAREMIHSVLVDEEYSVVGNHLDESTISEIKRGDYVDFGKLLPRDCIAIEEDHRLQPIYKDGQVYWQPPMETGNISSYTKWEQAFKVYAKIYTKYHPQRALELIQYSHDIHSAFLTFIWENVYLYDKEFRLHLAKHPMRRWGVILQHAWNLKMKDRLGSSYSDNYQGDRNRNNQGAEGFRLDRQNLRGKVAEPCKRYNRGKCNFGTGCKYEHRCSYCTKFGHGILVCRKLNNDKESKGKRDGFCKMSEGAANSSNVAPLLSDK